MHLYKSLILVAVAIALPRIAQAQTLRGQVIEQGSLAPVVAAQIVLIDSAGRQVGTVLTNEQGQFVLRAPSAGRYTFRADMIGRKSGVSRPIDLAENAIVEYRMELEVQPVSLDALTVRGRNQCGSLSASADVHTLWEEARKALAAEAVTREQQLYRFTLERHDREIEAAGRRVVSDKRTYRFGYSSNPYVTLPADTLAEHGYLRREGADRILYGPTGDVLLSDSFLRTHCFWIRRSNDHRGEIGLAFEPVSGRRLPDVAGTLWLDQSTAELRSLEFRYENLPRDLGESGYGGDVQFRRLPAGGWIVNKWVIRMPVVMRGGFTVAGQFHERRGVVRVSEQGGEVVRIATRQGRPIDQTARATLAGVVRDASTARPHGTPVPPLASAEVIVTGTPFRAVTDDEGRFRMTDLPDGNYSITYLHPRLDSIGFVPEPQEIRLISGKTTDVEMTLPFTAIMGRIGGAEARRDTIEQFVATIRGSRPVRGAPLPPVGDTVPGRIEGRVVDHFTRNPLSGVAVTLIDTGQSMITDSTGRFQFGGIPGGIVTLSATVPGLGTKSGSFRVNPGGHIDLLIAFGVIPGAEAGAAARAR